MTLTAVGTPYLVGFGPPTFSTSRTLACPARFVVDANGYYRSLGVRPDATRGEIRSAYQRLRGWESPRLTYILKQLLDPKIRAAYDATPLGELFWDQEVMEWVRRKEVREAVAKRAVLGKRYREDYDLGDIGYDADEFSEGAIHKVSEELEWPWAFYLWSTDCHDKDRLRRWQEHLIEALHEREETLQLSIGLMGGTASPWEVLRVGYRIVAFLNDGVQPNEALAEGASRVITEQIGRK